MKLFNQSRFILLALCSLFVSCTMIGPKEVGFKILKGGNYRGIDTLPLLTGINGFVPGYSEIITIPTTQVHTIWSEDEAEGSNPNEHVVISCMGGAGFKVDVGLNWRVDPYKASKIYLKYSSADLDLIASTYLKNVVRSSMNEVSGTISVDSFLNYLPIFENLVTAKLRDKLTPEGFIIDLFGILKKPTPSDSLLAHSIEEKIIAKQISERTKIEEQTSIAQANKDIAKARGDSLAFVISKAGEAEGIKKIQEQLTPTYVDYVKWVNASPTVPRVPSTTLGSNTPFIYNSPK